MCDGLGSCLYHQRSDFSLVIGDLCSQKFFKQSISPFLETAARGGRISTLHHSGEQRMSKFAECAMPWIADFYLASGP